ncbi:amino acid adenylation domain-containing protein [Nostoc sp.]|uniref:amino acid adenylation domain-containing protein n=1 Tax=Nostoc sp. TaxID=1180 RepID=UPI002FF8EA80
MNLIELLKNLSTKNVELWVDGDKLRYRSPEKSLSPELLEEIKQSEPEIIRILSQSTDRSVTYPLSHGQKALWFLYQLAPSSIAYNVTYTAKLVTNLDIPALKKAAQALVERHPLLRTTFATIDGEPVQTVHENQQVDFSIQEAFDLGQDDVNNWLSEKSDRPFNLEQGPILRFDLLINHIETDKLATKEHILLIALHQIVGDFCSLEITIGELRALYKAMSTTGYAYAIGEATQLSTQNYQYQDYINWSEQMLASSDGESLWTYWQQQLSGELPLLNLPTDRPRPESQTYNGASRLFTVDEELRQKLTKLAKREGASLYIVLLTALQILLLRYTNQEDILIGSRMVNRSRSEFENIVGYFTNPVVLRGDLSGKPTFKELLERSHSCVLDAQDHQDYPFPLLVEQLQPVRNPSFSPLYQVALIWNRSHQNIDIDGLILESLIPESKGAAFDITLTILEETNSLKGTWNYNTDLFDDSAIARMMGHFVTMLSAIVANPQQRIDQLPMLTQSEERQLLIEWNDTQVDYAFDKCIHQLFEEQVERTPDAVAVVFENQQLTYRELNSRANQLAYYLQSLGVKPDVLVGICVERSLEMVVGLLGILKAGGAYVPLDPEYPQDRLSFMLEDAQVPVLISQQRFLDRLPEYQAKLICLDEVWSEILQNKQNNLIEVVKSTDLANVIYTSGSTGKPKGVMVEHSGLCNLAQAQIQVFGLSGDSRVLQFASFSFDACISEILMALGSGARLYLGTKDSIMPGMPLIERLKDDGITHVTLPPSALAVLPVEELPTLQAIVVAGEACPLELMRQWSKGRNFFNAYGPTEASVCATVAKCTPEDEKITIGRPIANAEIYILDSQLQPVPIGVPGELHIGGAGVARGYLNRNELTQQKFIPNPFKRGKEQGAGSRGKIEDQSSNSERLYKTGDLARYLQDGNIEYLGRIDHQVKIRGFRIELGEIEAVLSQHPHVQASCVIAREDNRGDKRLVAYIVLQPEQTATVKELRSFLKEKLPEYMVPSAIAILESLPLTPNGKIDRRALPEPSSELSEKYVAPRTPIEEILAVIWQQVLKLELVGRHDNFFELGGHSLLATQFISRVRSRLKVEISLRELFAAPTIAELGPSIQQLQQQNIELSAPPILRRVENTEIPLSYAQQRLWFLNQLESNSALYNIAIGLRLVGTLNVAALEQSLKELIDRHEVLRTNFVTVDGKPTQIIQTQTNWTVAVVDLQHLPLTEQQTAAQKLLEQKAIEPFDLANDALIRATLVMLSSKEQCLLVCMHHVVCDGWSIGVFVQELEALYNAYSIDQASPLLPLPIQYADFAIWQRQWLQGDVLQNHLSYWEKQLANAPTFLPLPTDRPRPAVQTFNGSYHVFTLSVELTQRLLQLSQQQGCTLFMTLLGAYNTLLYRYTGQSDILVGTPIANRDRAEIEGLMGFFVNTLVMRTDLAGNPSFNELLLRLREMALSAYAHQDLPFETLVEALEPERDLSYTPLFQVMFVLLNAPMSEIELTELSVSGLPIGITTAKFDLTLSMENTPNGLFGWWEYNTDLFDSSTIERITGHFVTLLEAIVANPSERISQLPMLTASEQQQLLVEWNDTSVDYPQDKCIHQLFEEQVERTPDAVAVVFDNQQLTYHELNCRANQLAHYLRSLGVGADVLVGICVERSLEMLVGLLGILKAGGAYVPLDPEYPQDRLSFILEDAQVSVLLTQQHLVEKLPQCQAQLVSLDTNWQFISQLPQGNPITNVQASNLAYVIYTSGSTGQPKGVQISHTAVSNFLSAMQQRPGITKQDTLLAITTISFDIAALEIFLPITVGACLVIARRDVTLDGRELFDLLVKSKATIMQATPATWRLLLDSNYQFSDLKILCGGEALPWDLVSKLLARSASLWNLYGPTEATIWSSLCQLESTESLISIGRPIDNTQIYILDQNLQPVPIGVPGELHIGGAGLARGYLNRPELTQEKFIPNPFGRSRGAEEQGSRGAEVLPNSQSPIPSPRLYKTGDLARYLPDGNIEYLGRIDNQVKIRGFRIELGEIEVALSQHPHVQASCVIAREDTPGDKRLVAYIVSQPQVTITISKLRSNLKEKLPDYMVPSAIVILESLPLTPNGKIDRRALPAPEPSSELLEKYVAPRNPIEEILSLIWQQVLKVDLVGRHDNFFQLGGHSLLATQLISRVRSSLKVELPLRSLFAAPTIAELSHNIQQLQQQDLELAAPPILKRAENVETPLSYAQQRLWFLDQFEPNSGSYNIPFGLRLVGTLNVVALEQSLIEIIHRHEALRANFITVDGQATQIIHNCREQGTENREQENIPWTLSVVDLKHLPLTEQKTAAHKLVQEQAFLPFDLADDALIRATLIVLSPTEQWLLVCMHHVVSDGWSIGVFIEELQALYNAYSQGELSPLLPLPIQYADFAIWQRQWLQGEVLQNQLSYWKQQLANAPTFLPLPTDRPRPAVQTFNGAYLEFALSSELTQRLVQLSQKQGVTLFMTLLAAYNTLFYRYTGQTDILVGTPIANRDRTEIEGLIGFFVNTLVMRTDLSENPSFNELLPRIREMALSAYAHQDLPFEMLVEALQPERDLSYTPLFQVMFVLNNAPTSEIELTELSVSELPIESAIAKFDLTLSMENTSTGLVGGWEYNTDLFDSNTIERITGHFVTLLESIVANPQERISQLSMLTASEQQQLLVEWNDTSVDYPQDKCIHELFEEQVERTPDAVAVVFENEQLTYHHLNCRANQLAHYLQSLGVSADVLVGICVERSLEMVVGLLGILKAGGAYVPLDPGYPQDRLSFMLADAQVSVLLTQQHLVEKLPEHQARVVHLDKDWVAIAKSSQENLIAQVQASNIAYVIYTSGSTGQPKGVILSHSNLCNHMFWMQATFPLTEKDKVLQKTPFGFDASVWEFYAPLLAGGQLLIAEPGGHTDSAYLLKLIAQQQVTTIQLVPSLLQMLLEQGGIETCDSLKHVFCGGEVLPITLQEGLLSKLDVNLHNLYGPTEACIDATFWNCQREIYPQVVPIGRPISNTQIYILDQNLQPVPVGVPGELHIGGAGLAKGYLNRPELTQEKFIPNPFGRSRGAEEQGSRGEKRLYKTGDLARYLPDGNIEYLGRIDNQVKIRGFRIELGEIEAALSQHSDVQTSVVIVREDIPGNKRLVAYIVPQPQITPTVSVLRSFLKEKLPEYMVPSAIVILESLPLTPNGKIDRRALPEPEARTGIESSLVAPRTPIEEKLTRIWEQVLRVKQIGIHDNFFELGGDSILSIQIISRAKVVGIELTIKQLFANQTIAQLATVAGTTKALAIEQGLVTGTLPLTPIQHWFFEQELPEKHHFNQSFLLTVPSDLDLEILEQVWLQLLKHHDALRLRFTQTYTVWQQIHAAPPDNITIPRFDLSKLPETEIETVIETTANELQASLNVSENLVQIAFFWLGIDKKARLIIIIHHLVVDGVSWRILLEDLQTAYQQLSQGKTIQLPAKTTSFKDWARQLTEYAQSEVLKSELDYWLSASYDAVDSIPVDYAQGINTTASARTVSVSLNETETLSLLQDVPKAYKTQINDILLTALVLVLSGWTNSESVLFNLEGHGREEIIDGVDLSRTVGWFTTIFPVVVELEIIDDLGTALKSVKEQLRIIPNKGIGYGLLRYLNIDSEISAQLEKIPQAEISFNYLGQFAQVVNTSSLMQIANEPSGNSQSLQGQRHYLLDINAIIINEKLQIDWTYSSNIHQHETIENVAQEFVETLQELIAHCLSTENAGYTPTDFPLIQLNQLEIDQILQNL